MNNQTDESHTQVRMHQLGALLARQLPPATLAPDVAEDIARLAVQQGLAPMLLWTVEQAGSDPQAPYWKPALDAARRSALLSMLFQAERARLQTALDAAGIPNVWLKGIFLAYLVYPRPDLRPMIDLDVLVPYEQRSEALSALHSLHYRTTTPDLLPGLQDQGHAVPLVGAPGNPVVVELHQHIVGSAGRYLSPAGLGWFWSQLRSYTWQGQTFVAFSPEAAFLHLCAHAVLQHGEAGISLRQFFDLHLMLHHDPDLDWPLVVRQAQVLGWGQALRAALEITQDYFPPPLPVGLQAVLPELPPAMSVPADPRHPQPISRLQGTLRDLAEQPWPARLAWVLALIFPPFAYMRWRYGIRHDWQLPYYYLYRWKDVMGEVIRTFVRRISRRTRS